MWYGGIAWADSHHDALVLDEQGNHVGAVRVAQSAEGLAELTRFLEQISGTAPKEQMACIIETTHGLLIAALLEASWPVYPVNPRTVDRHRSAVGAKTDLIDAYLLAKTGRADCPDLRRFKPDSEIVAELKVLTRYQDSLIQMQTRLVNHLTACLKAYYPVALHLFSTVHQPTSLAFLQAYPTPQAAASATAEQLATLLKHAGHATPTQAATSIQAALAQPQLVADAVTTRTKSRLMLALVAQLQPLLAQIAAYNKEISTLFLTYPDYDIFSSLPRAGKRLAPRLLAEIGADRDRSATAASI